MSLRNCFLIFCCVVTFGIIVNWGLADLIEWKKHFESLKHVDIYDLFLVLAIGFVIVALYLITGLVGDAIIERQEDEYLKEFHKRQVAEKVMAKKEKLDVY